MEELWLKLKGSPKWSKWPIVKREEIPIRDVLNTEKPEVAQELFTALQFRHNKSGFYTFCSCHDCMQYREMILQLLADHLKSTHMWNILKALTREFYLPIIKTAPSVVAEVYEKLTKDRESCWQINGIINRTKVQHLEFVSDLFLTDNMLFVLYSTLLLVDDAHQLLELMSHQIKCFARAYAAGITKMSSSDTKREAEDTINYVLHGYEYFCKVAEKTGSYLFAFENTHLAEFSLSWILLNKQIYQKWVHTAFSERVIQCIKQLKNEVPVNRYIDIVKRYIKFDNEMLAINEQFINIWKALNKYHSSYDDQQRRHRILLLNNLFQSIRNDVYVPLHKLIDEPDWETYTDRQVVWQNVVVYIKNRWTPVETNQDKSGSCGDSIDCHAMSCECFTCLIIGGPTSIPFSVEWTNFKSTFANRVEEKECRKSIYMKIANVLSLSNEESIINSNELSSVEKNSIETDGSYHISWAVFKHLKDRKCYTYKTLDSSYFCRNCTREECAVAKKILNNEAMIGLSNILLIYYRPFALSSEEINEMAPNIMYYYRKVFAMDLMPTVKIDDIVVNTFWTFFHSIFARYIVDAETDSSQINLQHFELTDNDIKLNTSYIDHSPSNTILEYILKLKFVNGRDMSSKSPALVASRKEDLLNYHDDHLRSKFNNNDFRKMALQNEEYTHNTFNEIMDKQDNTCKIQSSNAKTFAKSKKIQPKNIMANEVNKVKPKLINELEIKHKFSINKKNSNQIKGKKNITSEKIQFTNVDSWIKETLSFIEGCDKIKCGNKKAEKKARQKLKKEESKRIEELYELRSQYHDLYFKEFTSKHELKDHKLAKRKNKKKIAELETNIKRLNTAKTKIESSILELLALLKSINAEFKFSYLPTREQQQEFLKQSVCHNDQVNKKCVELSEISALNHELITEASSATNVLPEQQLNEYVTDPSKRIVTIRRINLPDVSEPQVTVTAKGISPDKDKLLYTFINGQLVPATALDSLTLNILRPIVPKLNKLAKPLAKEQGMILCNADKKKIQTPVSKTKTQIKKEKKQAKSLKIQDLEDSSSSNLINEKIGKQPENKCIQNRVKPNNENSSTFNSRVILPPQTKPLVKVTKSFNNITNHECTIEPNVNLELSAAVSGRKTRKQKPSKEPTNENMLINNKFKLLHFNKPSSCVDIELTSNLKDNNKTAEEKSLNHKMHITNYITKKCPETYIKKNKNKVEQNTLPVNNITIEKKNVNKSRQSLQIDKTAINAENIVKTLHNSMQKLNLNADTTIELAKNETAQESSIMHLNISIMEQINKGVQVEKLTLPPGITLTKVDPIKAEALRVQRESIGKLSKPMQNQFINSRSSNPTDVKSIHQQNGIIMVDAMNNKLPAKATLSNIKTTTRNTRKSKKNTKIDGSKPASHKLIEPKMITLRNPMFHGANIHDFPVQVSGCMQMSALPMDQPAAIIKNDNGMFTIRNPALHQAFSNSLQSNSQQYSPYCYMSNSNGGANLHTSDSNIRNSNFVSNYLNSDKSIPAIGSEMKSCNEHNALWHVQGDNSYRNDNICINYKQPSCRNTDRCIPTSPAYEPSMYNSVHNCDDSPPPNSSSLNHYLDGIPHNSKFGNKYDDLTFLKTLMPGQRLNSEVTIHNINESKFSNKTASTLPHGVEITPVSSSITHKMSNPNENASIQNLEKIGEYGDNLFAPNQTLDLSELESDERDIETFKRFSYEFEPPKYKPKVHINVNDLLVNNKNIQNPRTSSPYIERSMEVLVHDITSLNISTEASQVNTCFSEKHNSSCNNCW